MGSERNVQNTPAAQCTVVCRLLTFVTAWVTGSYGLTRHPRITRERAPHIAGPGKDPEFKVWCLLDVYRFQTIVSWSTAAWLHRQPGTVCRS